MGLCTFKRAQSLVSPPLSESICFSYYGQVHGVFPSWKHIQARVMKMGGGPTQEDQIIKVSCIPEVHREEEIGARCVAKVEMYLA